MKLYLLSLGAGLLVGIIYALLNVRSPAPPIVALVGLLGILLGEQIPSLAKRLWSGDRTALAQAKAGCAHHILGPLPDRHSVPPTASSGRAGPQESCPS
jgi:XapX domain-containing protein